MSFGADRPSGRAPPWSGRAPLEWSRACKLTKEIVDGVVAHHPGGRAPLWSGRAPSKAWNLLEIAQIRPPCLLLVNFHFQMHNETLQGGNLPL